MIRSSLVLLAVALTLFAGARPRRRAVAAAVLLAAPALGIPMLLWMAGREARRHARLRPDDDPLLGMRIAHLTVIGLAAGLSLESALGVCSTRGPMAGRAAITSVLRQARSVGLATAARTVEGPLRPFFATVAGGVGSGAPIELILRSYAEQTAAQHRASRVEAIRRLPGKLAIPIALLLLPGFVLVVMGPTVIAVAGRVLDPFTGGG